MKDLRESHGCGSNQKLMMEVLDAIEDFGGSDELAKFLQQHYPQVIKVESTSDVLDRYFNSGLLTFPRRCTISAPKGQLLSRIKEFISDKIKYDYLIVGRVAYIEYLTEDDRQVIDQIPKDNWILVRHKNG